MSFKNLDRCWQELLILLILALITTPIFWLTDLDRQVAAFFYQPGVDNHWPSQRWWLWSFLYDYAPRITTAFAVIALMVAISSYLIPKFTRFKKPAIYIFLVIVLGPGLVVNLVFKDHWGRPRPTQISEFGGQHHYIPPLQIGDTGEKSFPCGHCSSGYALFTLYFLSRRHKAFYLCLTLVTALTLALARMSAGGHFVSDILWSGYLVFFVAWLIYYGFTATTRFIRKRNGPAIHVD